MHNLQHGYLFPFSSFVILPSCCKQSISSHFAFIGLCAHCSSAFCILCLLHPCEHLLCYPFAYNLPQSVLTIKEVSLLYFHFLCRYFAKKHFCYSQSFLPSHLLLRLIKASVYTPFYLLFPFVNILCMDCTMYIKGILKYNNLLNVFYPFMRSMLEYMGFVLTE